MTPLNRSFLFFSLLAATGASFVPARAQDFATCRAITDDKERLACFDHAGQSPAAAPVVPAAPAVPATPAAPPAASSPATSYNPLTWFGLDKPETNKPEDFGRSSMPPAAPSVQDPATLRSITAKVTQIIDPTGKPKFVLDNNQVWVAQNYVNISPRSSGNTVTIERSLIGYLMSLNGSSAEFSVRRLK
jgi:hypothetical protein